jgi:hypothetical protein
LLTRMDGDDVSRPVNSDSVKKYYVWCVSSNQNQLNKVWPGNSLCIYLTKKPMHDLNGSTNWSFKLFTGELILLKWGFKRIDFVYDFNEINQWFVWNNVQSNSLERDDQTSQNV